MDMMAAAVNLTPIFPLTLFGFGIPGYTALYTFILNLFVAVVLTPIFDGLSGARARHDDTAAADYSA